MTTGTTIHRTAIVEMAAGLRREGFCPIPIGQAKRPRIAWGRLADTLPNPHEVERLFHLDGVEGVAVICGPCSDLAVLDIDDAGMVDTLRGLIPPAVRSLVPWYPTTRGFHLWFRYPTAWAGGHAKAVISRAGVELILHRHYAICPPRKSSPNFRGCGRGGVRASLVPVPKELLRWLGPPAPAPPDALRAAALYAFYLREGRSPIPEGQRNNLLFRAACYAAATHQPPGALARLIDQATQVDGLTPAEAVACVESAEKTAGIRETRD